MGSLNRRGYEQFLALITSARKSAGVTQQELAARLGKPQSFVSKYENGERRLDVVEFLAIARAIGADPHRLIAELQERIPNT